MKYFSVSIFILLSTSQTDAQWIQINRGIGTGISVVDDKVAWTSTLYRTTNGGNTFNLIYSPDLPDYSGISIWAWDAYSAITSRSSSSSNVKTLFKTTNGGRNWYQVLSQTLGLSFYYVSIKFKDSDNGFALGRALAGRLQFWKTTDAGETWDSTGLYIPATTDNSPGSDYGNCLFYSGNNVWIGVKNSGIWHSSNNGASWVLQTVPYTGILQPAVVYFINSSTGYSCGGDNYLIKTTNEGSNWNPVPNTGGVNFIAGIVADENKIWYTRDTEDFVHMSTDNGQTWSFISFGETGGYSITSLTKARNGNSVWTGAFRYKTKFQ